MTAITGLDHPPARDLPFVTGITAVTCSSGYLSSKGRYDDMRFRTAALILAGLGLLLIPAMTADAQGRPQPTGTFDCQRILIDYFNSLPVNVLDQETIEMVILLREEEKLARDVYLTLSELYTIQVFSNIARSEQQHMDLVAKILVRYAIPDPAAGNAIGEFTDPWVQGMFDQLVALGETSLINALIVGATIEDVDILHLQHILDHSDFDDVNVIVQNMIAGSRNHMRSFFGALEQRGEIYEAQYIEQTLLDFIVSTPMETAVIYDENGDVLAECGRPR